MPAGSRTFLGRKAIPLVDHVGFRHQTSVDIRYKDLDLLGHVNNATYLTYLEQARIRYFRDLAMWDGQSPSDTGLIVAKITLEYKASLDLDDAPVTVWSRCSRLGNRSFDMQHRIVATHAENKLAATAEIVVVVFDYTNQTSKAVPEDWRERITTYEPELA